VHSPRPEQAKRRKRKDAVPFGDALSSFLKASGLALKLPHLAIYRAWDEAAGRELARRARPVGFRSGALSVEVESAAHLHELQNFTGEQYRILANARLGAAEIKKIVFRLKS